MSRGLEARIDDVRAVMRAARSVAEAGGAIVTELAASTGLSTAGVELALAEHLELEASDDELRRLVERAGDAENVAVILSSNVFVGALRAVAIARAASERVAVRPSRRDPAFARALVAALNTPAVRLDEGLAVEDVARGQIHVYGRDATIASVRARARAGVRVIGHGSGMGLAWISGRAPESAARALARDVAVFDQRGCLSPRVALVEGDERRANAVADALHAELERVGADLPRGLVPAEGRAESERYVATMAYAFRVLVGADHVVGVAPPGAPLVASPAYRHVHVAACSDVADAARLIGPLRDGVVAVGSDDVGAARGLAPPWARLSDLGRMQKPPLDGPVDGRSDGREASRRAVALSS